MMINNHDERSFKRISKITGCLFLLSLIIPLLSFPLLMRFVVPDNIIETSNRILSNVLLFRVYIVVEIIISINGIILAVVLYRILKSFGKNLSLLAFSFKLIDTILVAVITMLSFIGLLFVNSKSSLSFIPFEELKYPLGLFINNQIHIYSFPMLFLGLGLVIFNFLFLKSKYIPKFIAVLGMISFFLIFINSLLTILFPGITKILAAQIIFFTPSCIFELVIGLWLVIKGMNKG